ncbi:MAG: hypothetical protein A3J46_06295 [Candidatus Yanofskybacteria bacterium RIFCSPHIGHO2_02_FULL_41_11]|uniref:DUF4157 domain-containing protein n=1 Tax=Candidatus Yanofskybacteria bacterium RIFCSPHIGHO2_02_FULL_41_11 TaxID=1802675 RepID=A0A1F8F684_9BACT|nr:MAG: hypothetical protein A3J46_06295 [Candidatus Yanofskybacteria bacterium RIFCSPHIGHO2_02_FULL_41_11]
MIGFILNFPYTLAGLVVGLVSKPVGIRFIKKPHALIINVKHFWWAIGYLKDARAMTIGHVVLLGPNLENKDLEHELIHVEQYQRTPLVQPLLYYIEFIRRGYINNKYEQEAYRKASNVYKTNNF